MAKWRKAGAAASPYRKGVAAGHNGAGAPAAGMAAGVAMARRGNLGSRAIRAAGVALCLMGLLACLLPQGAQAQTRPRPRPDRAAIEGTRDAKAHPKPRPAPRPEDQAAAPPKPRLGPVTNQPLPRYVSLKGSEGNARRGPGLTHRIDWVFTTKGTPLRVTAEYENWRRVEDFEGFGGWVHFTLLSGVRTVLITEDLTQFYALPDPNSPVSFQAERGVIARVLECYVDWCRVNADGEKGWAPKTVMWGIGPDEVLE